MLSDFRGHFCAACATIFLQASVQAVMLWDRDYEDAYTDPGSPATRRTKMGTYVLATLDGTRQLIMQG